MKGATQTLAILSGAAALAAGVLLIPVSASAEDTAAVVAAGKAIATDRAKGNCLACHLIQGESSPGNIAPPLIAMQGRYPTKEALLKQLWDPTVANPETAMPPFGKHEILSKQELDQVVEYIWTL